MLFEFDPGKARAIAREHLYPYLATPYNIAKFRRPGYSEEEIAGGGGDRLVDVFAWCTGLPRCSGRLRW
ncbi:hypothetical protein [Streptosporangium roseum]|uniref:hypothetical protein n=1 Tax=Streptosporangium roseum TaxID=2001 RepID=UPI0001A3E9A4|nr:hypothetical protein [Streptosporangium roseum]